MLWNLLIHDWIKVYIYHDLRDLFNSKFYNRIASFLTIIISALFHEYVLWAPFCFIAPILLVQYGTLWNHGCTHYTVSFKSEHSSCHHWGQEDRQ
eukprot:Em0004g339a